MGDSSTEFKYTDMTQVRQKVQNELDNIVQSQSAVEKDMSDMIAIHNGGMYGDRADRLFKNFEIGVAPYKSLYGIAKNDNVHVERAHNIYADAEEEIAGERGVRVSDGTTQVSEDALKAFNTTLNDVRNEALIRNGCIPVDANGNPMIEPIPGQTVEIKIGDVTYKMTFDNSCNPLEVSYRDENGNWVTANRFSNVSMEQDINTLASSTADPKEMVEAVRQKYGTEGLTYLDQLMTSGEVMHSVMLGAAPFLVAAMKQELTHNRMSEKEAKERIQQFSGNIDKYIPRVMEAGQKIMASSLFDALPPSAKDKFTEGLNNLFELQKGFSNTNISGANSDVNPSDASEVSSTDNGSSDGAGSFAFGPNNDMASQIINEAEDKASNLFGPVGDMVFSVAGTAKSTGEALTKGVLATAESVVDSLPNPQANAQANVQANSSPTGTLDKSKDPVPFNIEEYLTEFGDLLLTDDVFRV